MADNEEKRPLPNALGVYGFNVVERGWYDNGYKWVFVEIHLLNDKRFYFDTSNELIYTHCECCNQYAEHPPIYVDVECDNVYIEQEVGTVQLTNETLPDYLK